MGLNLVQPEEKARVMRFMFKVDQKVIRFTCAMSFTPVVTVLCLLTLESDDRAPVDQGVCCWAHQAALYCRETHTHECQKADAGAQNTLVLNARNFPPREIHPVTSPVIPFIRSRIRFCTHPIILVRIHFVIYLSHRFIRRYVR